MRGTYSSCLTLSDARQHGEMQKSITSSDHLVNDQPAAVIWRARCAVSFLLLCCLHLFLVSNRRVHDCLLEQHAWQSSGCANRRSDLSTHVPGSSWCVFLCLGCLRSWHEGSPALLISSKNNCRLVQEVLREEQKRRQEEETERRREAVGI